MIYILEHWLMPIGFQRRDEIYVSMLIISEHCKLQTTIQSLHEDSLTHWGVCINISLVDKTRKSICAIYTGRRLVGVCCDETSRDTWMRHRMMVTHTTLRPAASWSMVRWQIGRGADTFIYPKIGGLSQKWAEGFQMPQCRDHRSFWLYSHNNLGQP